MNELELEGFDYNQNLAEQRELFKDCFPETNGEPIQGEKHYFWKFHSFPGEIKSWEYAAWFDKEVVGYYAALPYKYKIGNEVVNVGMVCDVMTSSKFRGKGIFTKLGRYSTNKLAAHVPFTMGYPIRKEVIPGHLKVGWKSPFDLPLYIRFVRFNSLLNSRKIGFIAPFFNFLLDVYNFLFNIGGYKSFEVSIHNNFDEVEGYEEFNQQYIKTTKNALIKDIQFMLWRFSAPERKYKFLALKSKNDSKLIGFAVFRNIVKDGIPSLGIIDFRILPEYSSCNKIILKNIYKEAKNNGIEAIICMMSSFSVKKLGLYKNGFLKSPFVFKLIIKNLSQKFSDSELFDIKNWDLMWIDSDDL